MQHLLHLSLSSPFNYNSSSPLNSPKLNNTYHFLTHRIHLPPTLHSSNNTPPLFLTFNRSDLSPLIKSSSSNNATQETSNNDGNEEKKNKKSFWGAVGLIVGTAVGPGMLGLPSLTIKSGPFPSTIIILLSWLYVISSIILVAELTFAAMEQEGLQEVSFTALATRSLGNTMGAFVSFVYASLSFSLLVACVAGIGSIFSTILPMLKDLLLLHSLFPLFVGILIAFFPFHTVDVANRLLCFLMLLSITTLVAVGMYVARAKIISSFFVSSWWFSSIVPIIPVAVLTLGFHVITPFICNIAGDTVEEAQKAILIGGIVPLAMVLSWNLIVLGLVGIHGTNSEDPISLLLSVNPSALTAIRGFAFSALATSLIGYAVSLPKQIVDTVELVWQNDEGRNNYGSDGRVGFELESVKVLVTVLVLGLSVVIASFFKSTFSRALDFAGVYANCFLFGILPPVMAYIHQSKNKIRESIIPGGNGTLLLLFIISVILGIWH
ncbi:hypothetical protein PIB30_027694 [Stylosanthes scabra]|uniref:Tyrosine-specific transport protein n=1 Tax=Stylosanthes scabra TaxID=79078 RepID=A0ABU6UA79_9FABA|nr:hypothetical protein [Stylosanthes scabra]